MMRFRFDSSFGFWSLWGERPHDCIYMIALALFFILTTPLVADQTAPLQSPSLSTRLSFDTSTYFTILHTSVTRNSINVLQYLQLASRPGCRRSHLGGCTRTTSTSPRARAISAAESAMSTAAATRTVPGREKEPSRASVDSSAAITLGASCPATTAPAASRGGTGGPWPA